MTRTAILHMLSAIAAAALGSALAGTAALAGELQNSERELVDALQTMHRALDKPTFGEKFKMAPAAHQGQRQRTHYQFRWWYD